MRGSSVSWIVIVAALATGAACGHDDDEHLVCQCTGGDAGADALPWLCSPIAQTGCGPSEKCTWIWDQVPPPGQTTPGSFGHTGCAVTGSIQPGQACGPRMLGGDGCVASAVCVGEVCRSICDPAVTIACLPTETCVVLVDYFPMAGVCESP